MIDSKWVIFLDIDGVLNNTQLLFKKIPMVRHDVNNHDGRLDDMICQYAVRLLNELVKKIDAYVVLSSSWRIIHTIDEMNELLKRNGATFEIKDRTVSLKYDRGVEIQEWLGDSNNRKKINAEDCWNYKKYIILDDDSDMLMRQANNFFKIHPKVGLTQYDVNQIIKFVQEKNNEFIQKED